MRRTTAIAIVAAAGGLALVLGSWSRVSARLAPTPSVDVPLRLFRSPNFPDGFDLGVTNGVSFGDSDHDGWVDILSVEGRRIWRNLNGKDFEEAGNLRDVESGDFYNGCLADYDDDNLPDIGTEPRNCYMNLLHNEGGNQYIDVGSDPAIVDVQPWGFAETLCIADVDGDGHVDLFLPCYPPWEWSGSGYDGNQFLQNLGPVGPGGATAFHLDTEAANLTNPHGVRKPEGAGFVDVDADGDSDLYSNGTLYRNVSVPGTPLFEPMTKRGSGIIHSELNDEGAGFFDYDMDGDFDLCVAFSDGLFGAHMFEARGDGTWFITDTSTFDSLDPFLADCLSFEDWDNDGDVDVVVNKVFYRNQYMETGDRRFTIATKQIDDRYLHIPIVAWCDFDRDGDLDAAIGDKPQNGHFFENVLYDSTTPQSERRYLRVKAVCDSADHDEGLEKEWGAIVSVHPLGAADDGKRRVKTVSSAAGYLNQNEYTLHFALPADPDPGDPAVDLDFELSVDFKGASSQGTARVDRHVNPILGDLRLAELDDREIVVYRSGRVRIDGCDLLPPRSMAPLTTLNGGLILAPIDAPIAEPVAPPESDWLVGTEISTANATESMQIEEVLVDGTLAAAVDCGGTRANLWVWDVTDPAAPTLARGGEHSYPRSFRNSRSNYGIDATLEPGRTYRIVARMSTLRATPITGPIVQGPITTHGGLSFQDSTPCDGAGVAAAPLDPGAIYLSARVRTDPLGHWVDLGHATAGSHGAPTLAGLGDLDPDSAFTLTLRHAHPRSPVILVLGFNADCLPIAGSVLVPSLDAILVLGLSDPKGTASFTGLVNGDALPNQTFYSQCAILDPSAPAKLAFSNALAGITPW
jgi:hypothetical protein